MQRYEPKPWDIRRCDMVRADDGGYVRYDDARAEIERLTKEMAHIIAERDKTFALMLERAEKAEAERDQAVAAAFKVAAIELEVNWGHMATPEMRDAILHKTPADARAALEAYGREKVREGMHLAATIAGMKSTVLPHYPDFTRGYAQGRSGAREAILAKMEKLK